MMESTQNRGSGNPPLANVLASAYAVQQRHDRIRTKISASRFTEIITTITDTWALIQNDNLHPETGMYLIANRTQKLSGVAGAAIGLVDRDDLEYKAATGIAANLLGFKIRADTSVSFALMKSQRSGEWGAEDAGLVRRTAARSILSAPIYRNRELAGCIQLFSRVGEFSPEVTHVCELMSAIVSQLRENNGASNTVGKGK
jgi:hypothetical protein